MSTRGAASPTSQDGCRGQFPDAGDTEVGLRPIVPTESILLRHPTRDWSFRVAGRGSDGSSRGRSAEKIAAAAKEKQPGEFRRWGRNHKNSASGCHSHFTAEGAGLQTSGKPGLECAGCIWNSSSKMRCQPPWIGRAAATDRSRDSSEDSRCLRESGGIGRRARLRIWCRKAWGFESPLSHSPAAAPCEVEFARRHAFSKTCSDVLSRPRTTRRVRGRTIFTRDA
jgi:hypothetical protein